MEYSSERTVVDGKEIGETTILIMPWSSSRRLVCAQNIFTRTGKSRMKWCALEMDTNVMARLWTENGMARMSPCSQTGLNMQARRLLVSGWVRWWPHTLINLSHGILPRRNKKIKMK